MNEQTPRSTRLQADTRRLLDRIQALGQVGALHGGGVCRLALTDQDREGRDLVHSWMRDLGLATRIDQIGTVVGIRQALEDGARRPPAARTRCNHRDKRAQPHGLQDFLGDDYLVGSVPTRFRRERNADGISDTLLQ